MSRQDKLIERLRRRPRDFTWEELERLLLGLGYREQTGGRTGGSRRRFVREGGAAISLHRPHPGNVVKAYVVSIVLETLESEGLI